MLKKQCHRIGYFRIMNTSKSLKEWFSPTNVSFKLIISITKLNPIKHLWE